MEGCCSHYKDFGFIVSKKGSRQRVFRKWMGFVFKGFPDSCGAFSCVKAEARCLARRLTHNLGKHEVAAVTMVVAMEVMRLWVLDTFCKASRIPNGMDVGMREREESQMTNT